MSSKASVTKLLYKVLISKMPPLRILQGRPKMHQKSYCCVHNQCTDRLNWWYIVNIAFNILFALVWYGSRYRISAKFYDVLELSLYLFYDLFLKATFMKLLLIFRLKFSYFYYFNLFLFFLHLNKTLIAIMLQALHLV